MRLSELCCTEEEYPPNVDHGATSLSRSSKVVIEWVRPGRLHLRAGIIELQARLQRPNFSSLLAPMLATDLARVSVCQDRPS